MLSNRVSIKRYRSMVEPTRHHGEGEHELQCECVRIFRLKHSKLASLLFAIPNGGQRHQVVAAKMKREGVLSGVPDLLLARPCGKYHGLWVEMKYGKNTLTENQRKMFALLTEQGYKCVEVRSVEEFIEVTEDYLKTD